MAKRPNKMEIAQMKVLHELGETAKAVSKKLGRSHHTIKKYLNSEAYLNDSIVQELVAVLKKKEVDELTLLGGKARARLHRLLDEGKTKAIETTAIMDRAFQQRRLLEGEATNINSHQYRHQFIIRATETLKRAEEHLEKLKAEKRQIEASEQEKGHNTVLKG